MRCFEPRCRHCDHSLDYPEEQAEAICFMCQLYPPKIDFCRRAKEWLDRIMCDLGGPTGRDRFGDQSPWMSNAIRALEDAHEF